MNDDQIEEAATRAGCWAIPWTAHGSSARHNKAIIAMVREITGKTCGKCKYWERESDFDLGELCKNYSVRFMITSDGGFDFEPPADFGCNKWEARG